MKKYRPSLTAAQVSHILLLAKTESPISEDSFSLIATLAPFQAKIENDGIGAAYTVSTKPKANSMESLVAIEPIMPGLSKERYWEACHDLYITNPTACNLQVIQAAQEHRYINDLMTPEEEKAHETKN